MTATTGDRIDALAVAAQHRGGRAGRRGDGAYFTDSDVADHLARRAIGAWLLEQALGRDHAAIDERLASGDDPVELLVAAVEGPSDRSRIADLVGALRVLDPTCGAGSFLTAAWRVLCELDERLDLGAACPRSLFGIDCSPDAVAACIATLELVQAEHPAGCGHADCRPSIAVGDAERAGELPSAHVLLGNPPYVRAAADERHADIATRRVPNRSAWIVERALDAGHPAARVAFVLPISTTCTDAFAPARADWDGACSSVLTSHFDAIPSSLFAGVVQRLSIYEGRLDADATCAWWTSRYHRWLRHERATLLDRVHQVPAPSRQPVRSLAKIGSDVERRLLEVLAAHPPAGRLLAPDRRPGNQVHYKRRWSYFLLFADFVPPIWDADGALRHPSELRTLDVVDALPARVLMAAYSSTLFWWYFSAFTDNRNVNLRDLAAFPFPELDDAAIDRLDALGAELSLALRACGEVRTCTYASVGTIRNTYYRQGATRPVLDRIDAALAEAYGMDGEQLDFVLGFERRFRS